MTEIERHIHLAIYNQQKIIDGYRKEIHLLTTFSSDHDCEKDWEKRVKEIHKYNEIINIHMTFINVLENL
jgi:hypothetical protein